MQTQPKSEQVAGSVLKSRFLVGALLLNRIHTMDGVSPSRAHDPSGEPALAQWLGLRINHQHWALSVHEVAGVFRVERGDASHEERVIDVVVHAGAAVFMAPMTTLFEGLAAHDIQERTLAPWVVALIDATGSSLGFRVDEVLGPFHAALTGDQVSRDAIAFQVLQRKAVPHA